MNICMTMFYRERRKDMKKNHLRTWLVYLGMMVWFFSFSVNTQALTIDDSTNGLATYYGGTIHPTNYSYNDVIGLGTFNVDQMVVTQSGGFTTVVLSGLYFGTDYAKGLSSYGKPGDLYISTKGWVVNAPSDHARFDTFQSTEGWDYVVSYQNHKVYKLFFPTITMTGDEGGHWGGYRTDQAWRNGYGEVEYGSNVWVTLDSQNKTLTYRFPDLGNAEYMGYHWTMACGNDVVEGGGESVPEPTTMVLLGLGITALALLKKKR